jgi:hypothetical protein
MKYFAFLSLILLFAACKKEDCEPVTPTPVQVYTPTTEDSLNFIWKLDTLYQTQNNITATIILPNHYLTFSAGTCLYTQIPGIAISPYHISQDTIYVDYSLSNVPTSYHKIELLTANKLILSNISPISSLVSIRNVYTKQ